MQLLLHTEGERWATEKGPWLNVKSQIFTCWENKKGEEKRAFKSSEEQGTSLYTLEFK